MSTARGMNIPVIYQNIPIRIPIQREEVDVPDSIHRSTEERALRQIAQCARYRHQAGGREKLTGVHMELLRLERAALQHLPQLTHDERIAFIISAAHLRGVSPRQVESVLDQASDIIMWRELRGLKTAIEDLDEHQAKRLYRSASDGGMRRLRPAEGHPAWTTRLAIA